MCGIVGQFRGGITRTSFNDHADKLYHRGPDALGCFFEDDIAFGHTRLSILDLDERSDQPFTYQDTTIVFNGEIWNYKSLRKKLEDKGLKFTTSSDTEVLAALLDLYGVEALNKIHGMFSVAWKRKGENHFHLARDIFGEIPIYYYPKFPFYFSSEIKIFKNLLRPDFKSLPPGHYLKVTENYCTVHAYHNIELKQFKEESRKKVADQLYKLLRKSVHERLISDVPICTLISGGIDSSAISYLIKQKVKNITAYTAVYNPKSKDLQKARDFASEHDIKLIEVEIPIPSKDDLKKIIEIIEIPSKVQIEIGWACYHLAKRIKEDGFKVIFSGEGADELFASYAFAYYQLEIKNIPFNEYRKDLFLKQSEKNFMRINKIFMHFGIEGRLPFLNKELVEFILSLPIEIVRKEKQLKYILSLAFKGKIEDEILFRPKVAFQDGMGIKKEIEKLFKGKQEAIAFYRASYKKLFKTKCQGIGL